MRDQKHQQSFKNIPSFLWQVIQPYKWWYLLMFQAPLIGGAYFMVNNYAIKLIVDAFSVKEVVSYSGLAFPIIVFILAQIILDVSWRLSEFATWRAEPYVHRSMVLKAYDYIQHHSYAYFQNHPTGTVISKLKGILDGYDNLYANLHHKMGKNFLTTLFCVFSLLLINTQVFLFMFIWSLVVIAVMYPMSLKLNSLSHETSESKHQIMGALSDNLTNIFSLFYFAKRQTELNRAKASIAEHYIPNSIQTIRYGFMLSLVSCIFYWVMLISIFLFTIWLHQQGQISTGDFVFIMMTTITISMELWTFITSMLDFMKEMGDFKASFSVLTVPHDQVDSATAMPHEIHSPSIEFRELSFYYHADNAIFEKLNLSIPAGQKIGIVGHSGAGKSTLISLLLKNFSPSSGDIFIDGRAITSMTSDSLRSQIALIPQDILLFHRTLAENIAYAKEDATLAEIQEAAKIANIHDDILSLPEQYNTLVGERGIKLSGGQRQRIAIARAILKNAPIIILDEATSSLDTVTEQEIQQSINQLLDQNKTTVIAIAHRLSTIRHMDRIVVMEAGQVIEDGTFEELMAIEHGYFKKLWESQVNGMVGDFLPEDEDNER